VESAEVPGTEVARELREPPEGLARTLVQPRARIINQTLAEYPELRLRPGHQVRAASDQTRSPMAIIVSGKAAPTL
jgi:hypothetical protein